MRPPFPANSKPYLVSVLLFGLIWQIGACPCGCVHHNLWLGIYHSIVGTIDVAESEVPGKSIEFHDCDHRPRDPFVRGRAAGEDGEAFSVPLRAVAFLSPSWDVDCASTMSGYHPAQVTEGAAFFDAHELRAHLQVFLL